RKRPFHTLIPALALQNGKPALVFGTRGADGQPQTQLQVLANVVDYGFNPQLAVEAPRWVHGARPSTTRQTPSCWSRAFRTSSASPRNCGRAATEWPSRRRWTWAWE